MDGELTSYPLFITFTLELQEEVEFCLWDLKNRASPPPPGRVEKTTEVVESVLNQLDFLRAAVRIRVAEGQEVSDDLNEPLRQLRSACSRLNLFQ